jgi:hypothetical protein
MRASRASAPEEPTWRAGGRRTIFWLIGTGFPLLVWVVAGFFFLCVLVRFDQDTTPITNGAFAVIATLTALCLSAARVAEGEARIRYARAGEGFLLAALLVMLTSLIRYGALQLHGQVWISPSRQATLDGVVGDLVVAIFGVATLISCASVRHLAAALELRNVEYLATRRAAPSGTRPRPEHSQ